MSFCGLILKCWSRLSYFGSASGLLRYFPDVTWSISDSASLNYDYRDRKWYRQTMTSHNNVILLIDSTNRHRSVRAFQSGKISTFRHFMTTLFTNSLSFVNLPQEIVLHKETIC